VTKVWKSVGAVSVYSTAKAAGVLIALAAVLAAAGFGIGLLVGGEDSASGAENASETVRTVTETETTPAPPAEETARGDENPESTRAAYRRGFKAGAAAGLGRAGDFEAGQAYVIRFGGSSDSLSVAQSVPVRQGERYYLCEGGARLCIAGP
jgi:hypothetical protein